MPPSQEESYKIWGSELSGRSDCEIALARIPDIVPSWTATMVDGRLVSAFEEELERTNHMPWVILRSFYPPRDLVASQYRVINWLNQLTSMPGEGRDAGY